MHANAERVVRYAGEFHVQKTQSGWKLVIDNNSGTYAPRKSDLPALRDLFRRNFPDMEVECLDFLDPQLAQYKEKIKQMTIPTNSTQ